MTNFGVQLTYSGLAFAWITYRLARVAGLSWFAWNACFARFAGLACLALLAPFAVCLRASFFLRYLLALHCLPFCWLTSFARLPKIAWLTWLTGYVWITYNLFAIRKLVAILINDIKLLLNRGGTSKIYVPTVDLIFRPSSLNLLTINSFTHNWLLPKKKKTWIYSQKWPLTPKKSENLLRRHVKLSLARSHTLLAWLALLFDLLGLLGRRSDWVAWLAWRARLAGWLASSFCFAYLAWFSLASSNYSARLLAPFTSRASLTWRPCIAWLAWFAWLAC